MEKTIYVRSSTSTLNLSLFFSGHDLSFLFSIKAPFGRGENKEDGKEEEKNMVKNGIFSYLVQERKKMV